MGKLLVQQIVSMDGFAAAPDGGLEFFGRVTYQMFNNYWPTADPEQESVAGPINRLRKYVVSSTLSKAPWGDDGEAMVIAGDAGEIRSRVEGEPGDVIVWGSLQLTGLLFREVLV